MAIITTIGLDLAKRYFQVHGVDKQGKVVLKKKLSQEGALSFFVNLPPCLVGNRLAINLIWTKAIKGR